MNNANKHGYLNDKGTQVIGTKKSYKCKILLDKCE